MGFILSSMAAKFFKKNNSALLFNLLGHKSGEFILKKSADNKIHFSIYGEDYSLLKNIPLPFFPMNYQQNLQEKNLIFLMDKINNEIKKLDLRTGYISTFATFKDISLTGALTYLKKQNQLILGATTKSRENFLLFLDSHANIQKKINLNECLPMQISISNQNLDSILISDNKKFFCKFNYKNNSFELIQKLTQKQNYNFNFLETKDSEIYFYGNEIKANTMIPLLIRLNYLNHQNLANFWNEKPSDTIHSLFFDYQFDKIWISFKNKNKIFVFDPLKLNIIKIHSIIGPTYFLPIKKTDKVYVLSEGSENTRFFSLATLETNRRSNYFIRLEDVLLPPVAFEGF